jgi:cell division protein ZapA
MPEIEITIGGRSFQVACQPGEEHFLRAAASALDREAQPLTVQLGRLPESRMLLMAGLMVADRTAALEEDLRALKARIDELEQRANPEPTRVEVPIVPQSVRDTLAEIAARAESLADRLTEAGA